MTARHSHSTPDPDPTDDSDIAADAELDAVTGDDAGDEELSCQRRQFTIRREVNSRLDSYLQQRLKGLSRSRVQKLIDAGHVIVNGRSPKPSTNLRPGDVIDIELPPPAVRTIIPEPIALQVIHEESDFIVLNKQAGLIVHPARSHLSGTLINGLAWRFQQQRRDAGLDSAVRNTRGFRSHDAPVRDGHVEGLSDVGAAEFRPGIIHRLDKNTTGVIVVAKAEEAHWHIARQFEKRTTRKAYLAVVHGNPDEPAGAIEAPIGKHPTVHEAFCVRYDHLSRHALSIFRVREQYRGYALVEVELRTGRTHQIRVHLSFMGYPIVGDLLYGGEPVGLAELDQPPLPAGARKQLNYARDKEEGLKMESRARQRSDLILVHPALHAALLGFEHPRTHEQVTYTAAVHEPMLSLIRHLRQRPGAGPTIAQGAWVDLNAAVPPVEPLP